jgi:photosystem II stability/assembly factor-like uncharacterized protein
MRSYFLDSLNGWVVGDSGLIIHTSNGGLNFDKQTSNTYDNLSDIFFLNKRIGWAVGNKYFGFYPVFYLTTDGGLNWNHTYYPDTMARFSCLNFLDSLNGFIGGYANGQAYCFILKTTDGGNNWTKAQSDTTIFAMMNILNIRFYNPQLGIACGGTMDRSGVFWETTDGGNFWQSSSVAPEPLYQTIILDSLNFICAGGGIDNGAFVISTSNSGTNWNYDTLPLFGVAMSIFKRTPSEWWVGMGFANVLFFTTNSGKKWDYIRFPDSVGINDVNFPDSTHGWAFGNFGTILKYTKFTSGIKNENSFVGNYELYQNYPNPFNPSTIIRFKIKDSRFVSLKVYDVLGREVASLVNEFKKAGKYEIRFTNNQLPSGLYLVKMVADNFTATRKIILLK